MTPVPWFAVVVGFGMLGQWLFLFLSRQIPELKTEPIRIGFHIAAEGVTALLLIISGFGLFAGADWSSSLFLIGAGMLFYTAIVSPGYFAQQGQWEWLIMFGLLLILGTACVIAIL